ncbi:unnamed protein product [Schistocephalus solidus]|uniref:GON-4-like protein n=1 Tax=Schistocephalus solidus TaxID=70667 RepID=A0A183SHA1_SCHSO|nr:unnamed protein product [Schistocephalus solidus]
MEPTLQTSRKRKKLIPPHSLLKRRRLSKGSEGKKKHRTLFEAALSDDWQLNMGASLAERLERIANEKKLTVPQVKRLLKMVLTNEDVVAAFRHYMDGQLALLEPETGEPSSATRRQAHILGVDPMALSRCSGDPAIENPIVHRVLTRSVAKKIHCNLRDTANPKISRTGKTRCTLQDMIFPDDDDDAADSNAAEQSDSDYQPTALDMEILQLDRLYDRLPEPDTGLLSAESDEDAESDENGNQEEEETSLELMSADSARVSGEDDDGDNGEDRGCRHHHYFTRSCKVKLPTSENILDTPVWIQEVDAFAKKYSPSKDSENKEKSATGEAAYREYETPNEGDTNEPLQTETVGLSEKRLPHQISTQNLSGSAPTDTDDHIYSSFLRSLFSPGVTSPNNNFEMPGESSIFLSQSNFGGLASPENFLTTSPAHRPNGERSNAEDFDDPDFDVMAEIDNVCSEDLFDELRNDRAVRVSKIEAKELRRDLTELFTEDDEEYDQEVEDEEPNQETRKKEQQALSTYPVHTTSEPPGSCLGSETSVTPIPIAIDMADRVKRQLSMHLQLLVSTYVATISLSDLEKTVCRPITSFVDQIHAILHRSSPLLSGLSHIRELLPLVDETQKFVHEFAGLSILPCFSYSLEDRTQLINTRYIPLPFFLMDYILRSALWPYPDLLPPGLAPPTNLVQQRHREMFTTDEDSLLVLGIANFAEALPKRFANFVERCNLVTTTVARDKPTRMQSSFFRFAATNLLPTRTPRQLYCRKCYIDFFGRLLTQRKSTGLGSGNNSFSSRSPLGLLLQDFQSPEFSSIEAKLGLLRSCVPAFARQTSSHRRTYAAGSIFSRPDVWHRLPAEYRACTYSLARQMAIPSLVNSAPVPTRDCLNVRFHASCALTHFFDKAMLSWWPSSEDSDDASPPYA